MRALTLVAVALWAAACGSPRSAPTARSPAGDAGMPAAPGPPLRGFGHSVREGRIRTMAVDERGAVYVVASQFVPPPDWATDLPRKDLGPQFRDHELVLIAIAPDGTRSWTRHFDSRLVRSDVRLEARGGRVVLAASFEGGIDFGNGRLVSRGVAPEGTGPSPPPPTDLLVAAFDEEGSLLYGRRFGDDARERIHSLALGPDGTAVAAGVYRGALEGNVAPRTLAGENAYALALGPDGAVRWARSFDVEGGRPKQVQVGPGSDGDVVIAMSFEGAVDLGSGPLASAERHAPVIARLGPGGDTVSSQLLGAVAGTMVPTIASLLQDGTTLVGGHYHGRIDLGGGHRRARGDGLGLFLLQVAPEGHVGRRRIHGGMPSVEGGRWAVGPSGEVAFASSCADEQRCPFVVELDGRYRERARFGVPFRVAGLGYDPSGRLYVATEHGVTQVSGEGHWLSCKALRSCTVDGRCTRRHGLCVATAEIDCARSGGCAWGGACALEDGVCVAADDAHCAQSLGCEWSGTCAASGGRCVASRAGCEASIGCARDDECALVDGECRKPRDFDCRRSVACREEGRCRPDPDGFGCIAGNSEDCRASEACDEEGRCHAYHPRAPCLPADADDCRRSVACRHDGRCTFDDDRPGYGCFVTREAQCRNSDGCRELGRCTLVRSTEGATCQARRQVDCERSEACAQLGRCRLEARRCVK